MKKLLVLTLPFFGLPVSAKSLPPILDYLPACAPVVVDSIYVEKKLANISNDKLVESSFHQVRLKAKDKRVDAAIITNLIQTNKLIVTADLIDFCSEDDSLSSTPTAYNQSSRLAEPAVTKPKPAPVTPPRIETRVAAVKAAPKPVPTPAPKRVVAPSNRNFTSKLMSDIQLAKLAAKVGQPSANVTLSGAYGININNSSEFLLNVLGPASAIFTLSPDTTAWLYGRDLWFYIENDKVQKISYKERALLNYTGRNFILYDEDFDNNWLIDDKAGYRDDVDNVRRKLNYLKKQSDAEYTVSNQRNLLKLDFSEFSSYNSREPELLLSGFTFHSRQYAKDENQIIYSQLNDDLLTQILLPTPSTPSYKLQDLVTNYVPNIINYSEDGSWEVLSKYIQVKHKDNAITKVKLSESINYPVETDEEFMRFLKLANIPVTKGEMTAHYKSDADVWAENVEVSKDDYQIRAEFTSEDDDAMLISLEVEYL
ncbi:hypothetical protein ACFOD0_04005 [Shewanella intestini]|uniref:Uncharacterized protein n=1 Tax=Shewanella intestini TaxID=2017544 RepID=A0ABS5I527_9GAMM|nr:MULTISPECIES: hypothetical protein [Shewanella]MBR9728470.1 hypothetical protein [Shewanella intestini]MRG36289.1 hypothetical protein [Shewanella sp. XMDDZSB0408]